MVCQKSKHHVYIGLTSPEDCPHLRILRDKPNESNTDVHQNPSLENEFGGDTFTFTSAHHPSESIGLYQNNTDLMMAILNCAPPMLLVYKGKYVNSGKDLKLECVFLVQFPFGIRGP